MGPRRHVVWSFEARRTLEEILDFVHGDSPRAAVEILNEALAAAASLATLSERGRVVPEVGDPSVREIFVHRYRLMYRVSPAAVEILTFIHGRPREHSKHWTRKMLYKQVGHEKIDSTSHYSRQNLMHSCSA